MDELFLLDVRKAGFRTFLVNLLLNSFMVVWLAALVGVRRETIGHLEKGQYNPSLKLAMDIAGVFGVKVEDLFEFTDE